MRRHKSSITFILGSAITMFPNMASIGVTSAKHMISKSITRTKMHRIHSAAAFTTVGNINNLWSASSHSRNELYRQSNPAISPFLSDSRKFSSGKINVEDMFFNNPDGMVKKEDGTMNAYSSNQNEKIKTVNKKHQEKEEKAKANREKLKARKKRSQKSSKQRVDRILSNRGIGTRKEVFNMCKHRRVFMRVENKNVPDEDDEINATLTHDTVPIVGPSERVDPDAVFLVDGVVCKALPLLLAYHKPKGVLSAMKDVKGGRKNLGDALPTEYSKRDQALFHPVGRLDQDTSGLILFSSNGPLTQHLLHPRHKVQKEYVATVEGQVDQQVLSQKLKDGVETADGTYVAELMDVEEVVDWEGVDDEGKSLTKKATEVRLFVTEGKHRMVRRMLANVGHPVLELRRERYGPIFLGGMKEGEFCQMNEEQAEWAEIVMNKK